MAKDDEGAGGGRKLISKRKLRSLIATARKAGNDIAEINGTYRAEVAQAVNNDSLNKKAFSQIVKLSKMENEDIRRWKEDFDYMFEAAGLQERMDSAPALPMGEQGEDDSDESAGAEQGHRRNVRPFPKPGSVAAE